MAMGKLQGTRIRVTAEDIKKSDMGQPNSCAIARAIKRTTRRQDVYVDDEQIRIGNRASLCVCAFEPPKKAKDFIDKFDEDSKKARPFEFVLRKGRSTKHETKEDYEVDGDF